MRRARLVAALMAVTVGIPYCLRMHLAVKAAATAPAPASTVPRPMTKPPGLGFGAASAWRSTVVTAPGAAPVSVSASAPGRDRSAASSAAPTSEPGAPTLATLPAVTSAEWASGKFADFSPEELADMVGRCELRWQLPRVPDERYVGAVRALYGELTGDSEGAAGMSLRALGDAIRIDSDDDAIAVHRRLAARRAGDVVDGTGSVYERYLQLQLDESERAHQAGVELGAKLTLTGCDPGSALFRSTR